jgi:hypothetical protein
VPYWKVTRFIAPLAMLVRASLTHPGISVLLFFSVLKEAIETKARRMPAALQTIQRVRPRTASTRVAAARASST